MIVYRKLTRADAHLFYEAIGFDGDAKRAFQISFR